MSEAHRHRGAPLVRLKPKDIVATGVELVLGVEGFAAGKPRLADGRVLDVAAVVWATGFRLETSAGSSCPSSTMVATQSTTGAWWTPRLACTFSGCPSSTRLPRSMSEGSGRTPASSPSTSSPAPIDAGIDRHPRPVCSPPPASRLRPANDPERLSRKELPVYDRPSYVWVLVLAAVTPAPRASCGTDAAR
jgi:hypothetical protein